MITKTRVKKIVRLGGLVLAAVFVIILLLPLPRPVFNVDYATTLRAKDGTLLSAAIAKDQQWRFPVSDSVPEKLETALLLFEDEYYYYHPGINPISLFRAIRQNYKAGRTISGGSTITMQTVRMALGNQTRTYSQKVYEILLALKLELLYSKENILKLYLDHAPFGGNIVGVNAAAYRFYGRPPHQLSWAEAATLAILPNNPGTIFPGKNQLLLKKKRDRLLDKIHNRKLISEDDLFLAKQEKLPESIKPIPNQAYHLLYRAIAEGHRGEDVLTTLTTQLQVNANKLVNEYSKTLAYNEIHNAAAIILDVKSGNTLAYVGNSTNDGLHGQHVDVITAQRSPGSLLKPFLYAAALDEGLISPHQLLPDIPIFYQGFAPKNFDKEYRGAVHADDALISSLNVPFVHLLIDYGYEKFHQKLQTVGFDSFTQPASHYGLSIILGGAESSLWELTAAYSGLVRSLVNTKQRPIDRQYSTTTFRSNSYLVNEPAKEPVNNSNEVMSINAIQYAIAAMQKLNRPDEESGWQQFQSSKAIAWKTGTSYGFRDGWAIGLSENHVIGVWVGNADGEGRPGLTGVNSAAPLLFRLFDLVDDSSIPLDPIGSPTKICTSSGMIASDHCAETRTMRLSGNMKNAKQCHYHTILHLNEDSTHQVNSACYPVAKMVKHPWFILPPIQAWYYKKFHPNYKKVPPFSENCRQPGGQVQLQLIYPGQLTKVKIPLEQNGERGFSIFEAAHQNAKSLIYWHLDNQYLGVTQGTHQFGIQAEVGDHTITLVDEAGNEISQRFEVIE